MKLLLLLTYKQCLQIRICRYILTSSRSYCLPIDAESVKDFVLFENIHVSAADYILANFKNGKINKDSDPYFALPQIFSSSVRSLTLINHKIF